jgi:hypothetical protein
MPFLSSALYAPATPRNFFDLLFLMCLCLRLNALQQREQAFAAGTAIIWEFTVSHG